MRSSSSSPTFGYQVAHDLHVDRCGCGEIDELEQAMHRVADLGRLQARASLHRPSLFPQPCDALGVVAVRAALEERERRVRETAHPVQRRRRERRELGQAVAERGRVHRQLREERELAASSTATGSGSASGGRGSPVVDGEHEARVSAFELDRLGGRAFHLGLGAEPLEHPADRRLAILPAVRVDRAGDDQPVDRAGHRDVVEAQTLRLVVGVLGLAHVLVVEDALALARHRVDARGSRSARRCATRISSVDGAPADVAAGVGDDHHLELEPLRGVDGQQAHRVGALLLGHRLELRRAHRLLVADEPDEAFDVGAAQFLVRAREPHQLAQVRVAALPVPAREHGEVVVVRRDDLVAEPLERQVRRRRRQPFVALPERAHEPFVGFRQRLGQRPLDPREERPAAGVTADVDERVVRHADERRGEHGHERLVVVAVVEQAQVGEQVDDLLLAEVPATGRAIGRQATLAQRRLVALGVGAGGEEEDDLAGCRDAGLDQLGDAAGDRLRLTVTPVRAGLAGTLRLSVTSSSTGWPNTGSENSPDAASGW